MRGKKEGLEEVAGGQVFSAVFQKYLKKDRGVFFCHSEGAEGDRRISKYGMLRFAMHDKKM